MSHDLFSSGESGSESRESENTFVFSSKDTDECMISEDDSEPPKTPSPDLQPEPSENNTDFQYKLRPGRKLPKKSDRVDFFLKLHEIDILPKSAINEDYVDYDGINIVPTIQMVGMSDRRRKMLVTVHNYFPYVYIDYSGPMEVESRDDLTKYLDELRCAIEQEPTLARRGGLITRMKIVKKTPFYGYHSKRQFFVKIFYCLPWKRAELMKCLHSGRILSSIGLNYHFFYIQCIHRIYSSLFNSDEF